MGSTDKPRILIANRGEIVRRVSRSCHALGLTPVVVYTEPDALSLHVLEAAAKVCLGASSREYTNAQKLLEVAKAERCVAVHPGYGFLSENADFVEACEAAGLAFLGPTAATMRMFSRKHTAREFAENANVPVLPGSSLLKSEAEAVSKAEATGYPVLLKATGGGGGIGIYICRDSPEVRKQFAAAGRQGKASFGDAGVFVEKYVQQAHHIEVQIFGDGRGNVVALGERECSIQRRHQKLVEESPSPYADDSFRREIVAAALRLGRAASYRSAGTVEFLTDHDSGQFYFLEVNTRLQVEHGITELVTRTDLVDWMLQLGVPGLQAPDLAAYKHEPKGWAIEVRLNAEDPFKNFAPSTGVIGHVSWPDPATGVRVDTWIETGTEVTPFYDSLLAKLMVFGKSRQEAVTKLRAALAATSISGIPTNLEYHAAIAASEKFAAGETTTKFLESLTFAPHAIEVLTPGINTTVQDWPGRTKLWCVGVPPSGPMDAASFRLANALVGNPSDAAGLEVTLSGPKLRFHTAATVAICGAAFCVSVNGRAQELWRSFEVQQGDELAIGNVDKATLGARCYLAVGGGINTPKYLGSRATFPSGKLGGVQGRPLRPGDQLPIGQPRQRSVTSASVPSSWRPAFPEAAASWAVGVLPGPNAAPDYFTEEDIATLHSASYTVHYNSNRLGIRLQGPRPKFARPDGGGGGSHPSNVHDHAYALGTVNFTGDMPVVLTHDGPSLGGFVCPVTITSTELWKLGQASPEDSVTFRRVTLEEAIRALQQLEFQESLLRSCALGSVPPEQLESDFNARSFPTPSVPPSQAVLHTTAASASHPGAIYRLAGDRCLFVEYGPMELDLNLRVRVSELQGKLTEQGIKGIVDITPGVRSCLIEYEPLVMSLTELLEQLLRLDSSLPPAPSMVLQSRIVHLPLAFNEQWTHAAIQKYSKSVRAEAPYLPSNVDFVAANNGLQSAAQVRDVVMEASYMVLGLGDVYLGAPCAVPVDPRHRLTVPKYNPARTFTPEGAVGIGGSYMCIYPMESPGGYQLVGRSLPIWNTHGRAGPFTPDKPWLLRFFDQVRFHEVSEAELEEQRRSFAQGTLDISIEEVSFSMQQYNELVESVAEEVEEMARTQKRCVAEQMKLDEQSLQRLKAQEAKQKEEGKSSKLANGHAAASSGVEVSADFTANVWEVQCKAGDSVSAGQTLIVLEAMKMEYPVAAPVAGKVVSVHVEGSQLSHQGDVLLVIEPDEE